MMQHVKRSLNVWRNARAFLLFFTILGSVSFAQTVRLVATFNGANGQQPNSIKQGTDENFYGTTSFGGTYREGTIFQLTPTGTLTSLYSFCAEISQNCPDGSVPQGAPLEQGTDGNFYGTTGTGGGSSNSGTMFRVTPEGDLSTLYDFSGSPTGGSNPQGLLLASNGIYYGVTYQGGANCSTCGTFFKANNSGVVTVLYNFCSLENCADGSNPVGIIQASNGNFYGATSYGGSSNTSCGTIFEMTPAGQLTTLHKFNQADGCHPTGTVIKGRDGGFYGTAGGGAHGVGVAFRMNAAGQFTAFYSFCSKAKCADGYIPNALLEASDGNFYGTTVFGGSGARNAGTIFQISRAGTLTTLYSFCQEKTCAEGGKPNGGMIQANDGNIYGVNSEGGSGAGAGSGTVFGLSLAPAAR